MRAALRRGRAEGGARQRFVCGEVRFIFLGGAASKLAAPCVAGSGPRGPVDELTIGIPVARVRLLRKEVIQPQVPLRLPCYDFTPVAVRSVGGCLHCWLAHRLRVQTTPMV